MRSPQFFGCHSQLEKRGTSQILDVFNPDSNPSLLRWLPVNVRGPSFYLGLRKYFLPALEYKVIH